MSDDLVPDTLIQVAADALRQANWHEPHKAARIAVRAVAPELTEMRAVVEAARYALAQYEAGELSRKNGGLALRQAIDRLDNVPFGSGRGLNLSSH